ncbi:MAG TPA: hypothetical protein VLD16_02735 [Gaiellaceae bacterium]|nr:hypothetical protein [Gaiellaceae bacterium]
MTDRDPALAGALDALLPSFEDAAPDWQDALRRGRRPRAHLLAAAVVGAVVVAVVVAPAFGIGRGVLPFFGAEKAPRPIVLDFASLSTGAPPGMDPGVIASETRKVGVWRFGGKRHTLFVAPTRAGGFCFEWTQAGGGCDREGTVPVSQIGAMAPTQPQSSAAGVLRAHEDGVPIWITGHANRKYVAAVEIRFEDGTFARPRLTWVSPPIDAGFFVLDIPADHRIVGHRAVSVVGLDREGHRVAEDFLGIGTARPDPLADAIVSEQEQRLELHTAHGPARLFTAPTRYDGRCVYATFEGKRLPVYPCSPHGYGFDNLGVPIFPAPDDVLLAAALPRSAAAVELRFADGDSVVLHPHGFLLYEIPTRHQVTGAELSTIVLRDGGGKQLAPPQSLDVPGLTACTQPLPLPPGTHCPDGF